MEGIFYNVNDNPLKMNKTLLNAESRDLVLLRESDVIDFDCVVSNFNESFNYVYIRELNRYYFVRERRIKKNGLYELHLVCDVLYTYRNLIRNNQNEIIEASDNKGKVIEYDKTEKKIFLTQDIENPFTEKYSDIITTVKG